mgnify:CR=1 FL=1
MAANQTAMSEIQINEQIARLSDILEQIEKLNQMIEFHRNKSGELSMMRQYEEMKQGFMEELKELLSEFKIEIEIKGAAA